MAPPTDDPLSKSRCQSSLALGEPFGNRFGCAGPVGGFSRSQQETEGHETVEAPSQRSKNRYQRVPQHGERQPAPCANAVQQPSAEVWPME